MKKAMRAGLFLIALIPNLAIAQSSINGTWKLDVGTLPMSTDALVWLLQDGRYQCESCMPPIDVKANGQDQPTPGQSYDTISVRIVDDHTVQMIERKHGQIDSDEKFTVSADGKTATDEFANWKT